MYLPVPNIGGKLQKVAEVTRTLNHMISEKDNYVVFGKNTHLKPGLSKHQFLAH